MEGLRKALVSGGVLAAVLAAAFSLYLWLALPNCMLQPSDSVVAPDARFVAVVESRICSKPNDNWAKVTLQARESGERALVFRLLEASGPIAVRWVAPTMLEIRYPNGAQTWHSTRIQGWPTVIALIAD